MFMKGRHETPDFRPKIQRGRELKDVPEFQKAYKYMSLGLQKSGFLQKVLAAEPEAGGASALVQLNNGHVSFISQMAQTAFRSDVYLNRAALGAIGRSECLNGPGLALSNGIDSSASYLKTDLRYLQVINEDIQVTMLLAKNGWRRLYSEYSAIQTAGSTDFRGWIAQGTLYTAYMCRTAVYDSLVFLWTGYYALTGRKLIDVCALDIIALEIIPPCYNYLRSWRPLPTVSWTTVFHLCYRVIGPGYRVYTLLTPLKDDWALSSTHPDRRMSKLQSEPELAFVYLWSKQEVMEYGEERVTV
ncbi:hypothetical protein UA08_08897 [Talaromyces atroroseus]|uniref:Uncharacterized protein n=1 Tax=Talaromyces atroroseus TaxID=1441469 RepID=A0A225AAQ8_TALAT|nr:hypothetical protein UA08_08897 [Talaromyces atroroseus]OKL55773.1 hypothetical protein UA08_08897 [Talaromyces atroroseus]